MRLLKENLNIDFMGKRKAALILSLTLIVISIVAIFMRGLNLGIDFTGGTLVEVGYSNSIELESVRTALSNGGFDEAIVQHFGTSKLLFPHCIHIYHLSYQYATLPSNHCLTWPFLLSQA